MAIVRQVAAGGAHTAALSDDGDVYMWGLVSCARRHASCLRRRFDQARHQAVRFMWSIDKATKHADEICGGG
jgi:alpha-tubulin suppressor-like RCC1 family protein